jgi:hypothetical protein
MSYVISVADAGGTPVLTMIRSRSEPSRRPQARSAYFAPVGPPPITASGAIGLQYAITLSRGSTWPTYTTTDGQQVGVTLAEVHQGRQLKSGQDGFQFIRKFYVHGTYDPAAARDIGPQVGDRDDVLTNFYVEERMAAPYAAGGGEADIVLITCTYSKLGAPSSGGGESEPTFSYDFGSESEHIDRALAQVHYGDKPRQTADLINVTNDEVQGLEINSPILDVCEEHVFTEAQFSPSMRRALRDHLQKTNEKTFREFAIGEVLFVGASARKQAKRWYVTFQFRVRRNVSDLSFTLWKPFGAAGLVFTVIPSVVSVEKRGWQYLWIESVRMAQGDSVRVFPRAVHVATVYDEIDFGVLGIGTDPLP